jgi:hypothetical protein
MLQAGGQISVSPSDSIVEWCLDKRAAACFTLEGKFTYGTSIGTYSNIYTAIAVI